MAVNGSWNITIKTPMGEQKGKLTLEQNGAALSGTMASPMGAVPIENGAVDGDSVTWHAKVTSPMPLTLEFSGKIDGGNIGGSVKLGAFGSSTWSGTPA